MLGHRFLACQSVRGRYFYLPGGHVEPGETVAQALEREFREETGLSVTASDPVFLAECVFRQNGKPRHEISVVCHVARKTRKSSLTPIRSREAEITFEWLDIASLPDVDFRPPAIKAWLTTGG